MKKSNKTGKLNIKELDFWGRAFAIGALIIDKIDYFVILAKKGLLKALSFLVDVGAKVVTGFDNFLVWFERFFLNFKFKFLNKKHDLALFIHENSKEMAIYFTGLIVVSILLLSSLNAFTGYEYSYKGRNLGIVANEDDVVKVVDIVNKGLSEKYDMNINIDPETDMDFVKTYSVDKDIDNMDTVLKRMSNMSDTRTEAYAIKVNGKIIAHTETKENADNVLKKVIAKYVPVDQQKKYEQIGFVENVQVERDDTIIADVKTEDSAYSTIIQGDKGEKKYTVKEDDSAVAICEASKISIEKLKELNPKVDLENLKEGDVLLTAEAVPSITVKAVGVLTYNQAIDYTIEYKDDPSMYEGDSKTYRNGEYGTRAVTSRITYYNGKKVNENVLATKVTKSPVARIVLRGSTERPATVGSGSFAWPVYGSVTGFYGYEPGHYGGFHSGIDISGIGYGAAICAADGGTVTMAGPYGGYGNCVMIDHQNGFETLYGHNSSLTVSVGEKVYKGQQIACAGSTGFSFCVHCHFEIHRNGATVDPLEYLP